MLTISLLNNWQEVNIFMAWKFKLVGLLLAAMALTTTVLAAAITKRFVF
jgi:hypothetical protein